MRQNSDAENGAVQAAQNKTAADIVNSDAVSERSAKRVPLRAVLCAAKNGQRGSGIAPVASRVRHRIAPRLGAEIFLL